MGTGSRGCQLAFTIALLLCPQTAGFSPLLHFSKHGRPSCTAVGPLTPDRLQTTGRVLRSCFALQAAAEAAAEATSDEPVKIKRLHLKDIFNKERNYLFSVAKNIREYSWEANGEVEEMYTDIMEELQKGEDVSVDLGQVVLVRGGDAKQVVYEVADGQQRLITLCLLFAAIRDSAAALGDDDLKADVQVRLMPKELKKEDVARVLPSQKDRKWFTRVLQGNTTEMPRAKKDIDKLPSKAEQNMIANYLYYIGRLKDMDCEALYKLQQFLLGNVNLDLNVALTASIARKMVLGMRKGKDTEPIDLFKGIVVYSIQNETLQDTYLERWRQVEGPDQSTRKHFTDACLLTAQAHVRKRVKKKNGNDEWDVLEAFWKLQDQSGGDAFFDHVLAPAAQHLRDLSDADAVPFPKPTPEQRCQWQFLQRVLGSSQTGTTESKLAVLHALNKGAMCPELLALLERMTLYFVAMGGSLSVADRFNRTMALVARMDTPPDDDAPWPELSDQEKRDTLAALDKEDWGDKHPKRQVALAVLLRVNSKLSIDGCESFVTPGNVTIEHVLPQSPEKDSRWLSDWNKEQREEWLHRLGNLCVLGPRGNSKAKNNVFDEKKLSLSQAGSGFPLTGEVAKFTGWTQESVTSQHKRILYLVESFFFGPGSSS